MMQEYLRHLNILVKIKIVGFSYNILVVVS